MCILVSVHKYVFSAVRSGGADLLHLLHYVTVCMVWHGTSIILHRLRILVAQAGLVGRIVMLVMTLGVTWWYVLGR